MDKLEGQSLDVKFVVLDNAIASAPASLVLGWKHKIAMVALGIFEVAYTHRGSWKATRKVAGKAIDEVPVAWNSDWYKGNPPTVDVWFKSPEEAASLIALNEPFVVAIARKLDGNSSSENFTGLFKVQPTGEAGTGGHGIHCRVLKRVSTQEDENA